ncbi:MAG TPA: DUF1080 domain-containing protein [Gemmataceae bacterium]|nr:DUF1080 domain-containing protein [Gemmataceae bacterium]
MPRAVLLVTLVLWVPAAVAQDTKSKSPDWKPLFDGKTLDGWKASFDKETSGKVHVKDGAIVLEKGMKMTGVTYAGKEFPKTDYEVVLESKRVDGRDFFATTTFPVGDGFCSLVVGGWGGRLVGVSSINGSDASENETTGSVEFQENTWYKIRIRVTEAKLECWIGDEKVVDVERKGRKFSTRIECDDCQPFGIATYDTVGAVRDIKLRKLTDGERKGTPEKK